LLNRLKNCFPISTVEIEDDSVNSNTYNERIGNDTDNDFQVYLNSLSNSQEFPESSSSTTTTTTSIRIILNTFENSTKLPYREDNITFWKNKKNEMPELYQLSKVLMGSNNHPGNITLFCINYISFINLLLVIGVCSKIVFVIKVYFE